MAWKSSFRQNYRTTFSPTVPTSAVRIPHVVAHVEAPGSEKWECLRSGGKQWQATPKNLPRMQRTRAIPVALTELWSLPRPAQGLNTNNNNKSFKQCTNYARLTKQAGSMSCSQCSVLVTVRTFVNSMVLGLGLGLCASNSNTVFC